MMVPVVRPIVLPITLRLPPRLSLPVRRTALLARIHAGRERTTEAGRRVAADLQATERYRRSILTGLKVLKASVLAAGVIWSLNATSRIGRGRRLFTIAISLLSTIRAMRKVSAFLIPLTESPGRQG